MSEKYKKREPTGREFVDTTIQFRDLTVFHCMKLPERWMPTLLVPLLDASAKIESQVIEANRIYISDKNQTAEQLRVAYEERIRMLSEALRTFKAFDQSFERMMRMIDIQGSEKRRLKNIVLSIIDKAKEDDEELKELEIKVVSRLTDMEYRSVAGKKTFRLSLTSKGKDRWIATEAEAIDLIKKRIESDKRAVSRLRA